MTQPNGIRLTNLPGIALGDVPSAETEPVNPLHGEAADAGGGPLLTVDAEFIEAGQRFDGQETELLIQPSAAIAAAAEYPIFRAPYPCQILDVAITNYAATLAADDTNYWVLGLKRRYAKGNPVTGFGLTYQERVLRDAPIRYWPLQETAGVTADEVTGNGADGTYTGGVTLAQPGPAGLDAELAASFDGVDDYVAIPSETWALGQTPGMEAWVNLAKLANAGGGNRQMLIGSNNAAGVPQLEMGGLLQSAYSNGPAVFATGIANFLQAAGDWINNKWALDVWHYVAWWVDATGSHLFMNGIELPFYATATPGWTLTNTATVHALGRRAAGSEHLQGRLAHCAVYAGNFSLATAQAHWDHHTMFGQRTTRDTNGGPLTQYVPASFGAYPWRTSHYQLDRGDVLALDLRPAGAPPALAGPGGPLLVSVRHAKI